MHGEQVSGLSLDVLPDTSGATRNRDSNHFEHDTTLPTSTSFVDPAVTLSIDRSKQPRMAWTNFQHIILFGDSYSSKTKDKWIGYLKALISDTDEPLSVHNFAVSGNTVEHDLSYQLDCANDLFFAFKSLRGNPKVLVVCWMGINDCLSDRTDANDLEAMIEKIFEAMHDLYVKWKVRSFIIMDIPPLERSPGGLFWNLDSEKFDTWNEKLLQQARMFAKVDSKASVFVVSAHKIVSEILNYPNNFGFSNPDETEPSIANEGSSSGNSDDSTTSESSGSEDLSNSSSGQETDSEESCKSFASGEPDPEESSDFGEIPDIWQDDIHLSSDAHRVFADRLLRVFDT